MACTIHIIAPYMSMVPVIKECISDFKNIHIGFSVGDLEKGVQIAKREEKNGTNIIISRGGTAQLIRKNVNIPVIDMQLSGYDLLRSLTLASNIEDKTAVVGFSNITSGAVSIINLLDLPINVYTVDDSNEVAPLLLKLKKLGYKQILGDFITTKTSQVYGLQGMLLQSGKESIARSIEEALFVYTYLNKKNKITHTMEQFILKDNPNIMIVDENNQVIYERFNDFDSNPISQEELYILNTNLNLTNKIHHAVTVREQHIIVTGYRFKFENRDNKLYTFFKNETEPKIEKGLHYHNHIKSEPLAVKSDSMAAIVKKLTSLYEHNEPVYLLGEQGTGKRFIIEQIHNKLAKGLLVTVNGLEFKKNRIHHLLKSSISTIIFTNAEELLLDPSFPPFIKKCQEQDKRIFVIAQEKMDWDNIEDLTMNLLFMPSIQDRREDIHDLTLYFLAEFHQNYGTKAIKITDEALQVIETYRYKNHVDSLKTLIKQLALNEQDYMIHKETVEKVLFNFQEEVPLSLQGTLKEIESKIVKNVLIEEGNNQTKAAQRLGISRSTLWRKLKG